MRPVALVVAVLSLSLVPTAASAQTEGVGVVTTLTGQATVARAALPQPAALSFKDSIFERDRVATAEKSLVRILLGGRALLTIRELSQVTITEDVGRATVELASGKIGLAAVRQRMRPGERLEIRTPNAVASIRGTVLVVEILRAAAAADPSSPGVVTNIHVLKGSVEVADPAAPTAPPVVVDEMKTFSRAGDALGILRDITPNVLAGLLAGLQSQPEPPPGASETILQPAAALGEQEASAQPLAVADAGGALGPASQNPAGNPGGSSGITVDVPKLPYQAPPQAPPPRKGRSLPPRR